VEKRVVFGVADLRCVLLVVELVRTVDPGPQVGDVRFEVGFSHGARISAGRRDAASESSGSGDGRGRAAHETARWQPFSRHVGGLFCRVRVSAFCLLLPSF
jgi:hypothetical protein